MQFSQCTLRVFIACDGLNECVPIRISKVSSMFHHRSVGRVHATLYLHMLSWHFFVVCLFVVVVVVFLAFLFFTKTFVLLSFSFLFLIKYRILPTEY